MIKRPDCRNRPRKWVEAQSERVAWRIVLNWVEIQAAMIKLKQVDALEIFMPYLLIGSGTLYEKIIGKGIWNTKKLLMRPN